MVKNPVLLKKFDDNFIRYESKLTYSQSLNIFTDMWNEEIRLHVLPSKDPLEGIEVDIKIAKVLNSCLKNSFQG
ncbi:MAG: hypothetical protein QY310_12835 [Candidatus Jettenia sp. CY-1]|nr:hypothetical protein [Candidatus Jettenia sp.]WKZ18307.1 MAG: hypothetical protein QY310_12835 [Candidatus Jettenia sp. CY-1]